ncbi:alpha/beta fold hydrolase [Nocardia asteroides]|uniref:alpha/beta fold hydrolase n=1 Tax=Nocardia asteroides TaxID=1824 RepID=UPI001E5E3236|nr:alpha/beta hydrolase [Nocardia asteroides]UGT60055.1 alpha/beta hydrolase [Nocardia asteroides]
MKRIVQGGAATAVAVSALAVAHVLRRMGSRVLWPARADEYRDEDFGLLGRDRAAVVHATDGVPLAVREHGPADAAVTVVFVHGFCNDMTSYHFQRRDLPARWGDRARLVFYDQRGHGESGVPEAANCTVAQLADDLAAVVEARAPHGPVVLVGHSLGGMAVLAAAAAHQGLFRQRVAGVVLICTTAAGMTSGGIGQLLPSPALDGFRLAVRFAPALVQAGRATARHVITPLLHVSSFHGQVSPTVSRFTTMMIDRTPVATIVKFLQAIEVHDESAALPALAGVPALVIGAGYDRVIPFKNSELLARELPEAELVRLDDGAHMPHLQFPDAVNAALDRLFARAVPSTGERRAAGG